MANPFEDWRNLFGYNRELFEEDWNDGKLYTVKMKNKGQGVDATTTTKIGPNKDGAHSADFEQKIKYNTKSMKGMEMEFKAKNNGSVWWESESEALTELDAETFKGHKILTRGSHGQTDKDGKGINSPMEIGHQVRNDTIKMQNYFSIEKEPKHQMTTVYNWCDQLKLAALVNRKALDLENAKYELAFNHNL